MKKLLMIFILNCILPLVYAGDNDLLAEAKEFLRYGDAYWNRIVFPEKYDNDPTLTEKIEPAFQKIKDFFYLYLPEKFPQKSMKILTLFLLQDMTVDEIKLSILNDDIINVLRSFAYLAENEKKLSGQTVQFLYLNNQKKQKKRKQKKPEYTTEPLYNLKFNNEIYRIELEKKQYKVEINTQNKSLYERLEESGFSIEDIPFLAQLFLTKCFIDLDVNTFVASQELSLFSLTTLFQIIFLSFIDNFLVIATSKDNMLKEKPLTLLTNIARRVNNTIKIKQNMLISYVNNALSYFGEQPRINQENLQQLRSIFENIGWIKTETEEELNARLLRIEEKRIKEELEEIEQLRQKQLTEIEEKKRPWRKYQTNENNTYHFSEPKVLTEETLSFDKFKQSKLQQQRRKRGKYEKNKAPGNL